MFGFSVGEGFKIVNPGDVLDPATATNFISNIDLATLAGPLYLGLLTADGNVGWFKLEFDFAPSPIVLGVGEYGSNGETLTVGGTDMKELLGDINCDGAVNLLDVEPFVELLATNGFSSKADFDSNGLVNLLDVQPFVEALSGN